VATLPNGQRAIVPLAKVLDYLLSESHPDGRSKARFFRAGGFTPATADALADALRLIARDGTLVESAVSPHGRKYVVDGRLMMPLGGSVLLRTIWITDRGTDVPRLVTAYPGPRERRGLGNGRA